MGSFISSLWQGIKFTDTKFIRSSTGTYDYNNKKTDAIVHHRATVGYLDVD